MNLRELLRDYLGIVDPPDPPFVLFPVEVDCFVGSNHKNDEVDVEGYIRGDMLYIWFKGKTEESFRGDEGHLRFVPAIVPFKYGGVGPHVVGSCRLRSERLKLNVQGTARWYENFVIPCVDMGIRGVDGRVFVSDENVKPDGVAWPIRTYYGLEGSITIPIP